MGLTALDVDPANPNDLETWQTVSSWSIPAIFGEEGDSCLLGALTLEALGFSLDPLRRELNPLPMLLAAQLPWVAAPQSR
jgi:hypothetical protein